ncbi:hypothetical protein TVAG_394910 [Trichomonas vaginalis G3]|uniref:receptor protein-tyrosine kinase n=1 Tax=Trichomonas vaginalis (strain ATCC PRA-98 / G3) TaxID=412133 RepID=A2EDF5_TRIV3|nr:hypothetical protein TVAG_394910 [Trichomonas vaginalis G3]|eukprot:XP_001321542.1 hypothetical protein [Trichomonas vaginalis G3]
MISYKLVNESAGSINVTNDLSKKKVIFEYPCENNHECTDYEIQIFPGYYKFELYGASGGHSSNLISSYIYPNGNCISNSVISSVNGHTVCNPVGSRGGAGGFVSGKIRIKNLTKIS